jgi:putative CocE/NonD family hydrolase
MTIPRFFSFLATISVICSSLLNESCSQNKAEPGYQEVNIPMSDGVLLSTDIYIPKHAKQYPIVLVRTPYSKSAEKWMGKAFGIFGIGVVVQDVRGKYKSGGEFYPFINERSDGLQTLRWIRQQSWSSGVIAGWGGSYSGITQWAVSDSLDLMSFLLAGGNLYDFLYPDSLFSLQSAFTWGFQNALHEANSIPPEKLDSGFKILPLSAADDSIIENIPFINDWIKHENYDNYWDNINFRGYARAPMLSIAGWYDIFLKAQIDDFQELEKKGIPDNRLIIGPWCHGSQGVENQYGGLSKTGKPQKIFKYVKNYLKGRNYRLTSPLKDKKFNLFIMERNEYVGSDVWPPVETTTTPYYIGSGNYIGPTKPMESGVLQFDYDPADPFPSHGGTALGTGIGPAKQNDNISRNDQLAFEMNIEEKPLILLGPVSATLWVSSDAPCTDFIICMQDVFPDGNIINIQEGGARIKFTDDKAKKSEISLWATGYQLNPGHKLRVIITSSLFPRYNRSLNACESIFNAKDMVSARQSVYYGGDTPSSINFPIYYLSAD